MPENSNPTSQQAIAERVFNAALSLGLEFSLQREGDSPERLQPVLLEFIAAAQDAIPLCSTVPAGWTEVCFYLSKLGKRAHTFKKRVTSRRAYAAIPESILKNLVFDYSDDFPDLMTEATNGNSALSSVLGTDNSEDGWDVFTKSQEELSGPAPSQSPYELAETDTPTADPLTDSPHKPRLKNWGIGAAEPTTWILFRKSVRNGKMIWENRGTIKFSRGNQGDIVWNLMMHNGVMSSKEAIECFRSKYPGWPDIKIRRSVTVALNYARKIIKKAIAERSKCKPQDVQDPFPNRRPGWRAALSTGIVEKNDDGVWEFRVQDGLEAQRRTSYKRTSYSSRRSRRNSEF